MCKYVEKMVSTGKQMCSVHEFPYTVNIYLNKAMHFALTI